MLRVYHSFNRFVIQQNFRGQWWTIPNRRYKTTEEAFKALYWLSAQLGIDTEQTQLKSNPRGL